MKEKEPGWEEFERWVERLFRSTGYDTDRNIELAGYEYDAIASKTDFASYTIRIAIEAKYKQSGAVSNKTINNFMAAYQAQKQNLKFTRAIVVTNTRFSRQAHEAAKDAHDIRLITKDSLEDELLGANVYLDGSTRKSRDRLRHEFIDLASTSEVGSSTRPVDDTVATIATRITSAPASFSLILGDFGTGKTSLAEALHRRLSAAYSEGRTNVFPFIYYLKTLPRHDSDDLYIASQLANTAASVSPMLATRMAQRGPTVAILDGFDEIATHASADERWMYFSRVMGIAQNASHVVLTSRPAYFSNLQEWQDLLKRLVERDFSDPQKLDKKTMRKDDIAAQALERARRSIRNARTDGGYRLFPVSASVVYHLKPFTKKDVIKYLSPFEKEIQHRHGKSVERVYDIIAKVYDLSDLISRPLLLDMFLDLLLGADLDLDDPGLEMGPAGLYQLYVDLHLDRDWKLRQFLNRDERLNFARAAAAAMLEHGGSLQASYGAVEEIVRKELNRDPSQRSRQLIGRLENVATDVRVCAFINITASNRIEFAHKSFMEFFVADSIVRKLADRLPIDELTYALNYEILYFVGSFCMLRAGYRIDLLSCIDREKAKGNVATVSRLKLAFLFSEQNSRDRVYDDFAFEAVKIRRRNFVFCTFSHVRLSGLALEECDFSGCNFSETAFLGEISQTRFIGCEGSLIVDKSLHGVDVEGNLQLIANAALLRFEGGTWREGRTRIAAKLVQFAKTRLYDVDLALINAGTIEFHGVELSGCSVEGALNIEANAKPTRHLVTIDLEKTKCRDTRIDMVKVRAQNFSDRSSVFRGCYGCGFVDVQEVGEFPFHNKLTDSDTTKFTGWTVSGQMLFVDLSLRSTMPDLDESFWRACSDARFSEVLLKRWAETHFHA